MSVIHRMTGYDRCNERLAYAHPLPEAAFPAAKDIAHVPATDADAIGSYPLDEHQARNLARRIGADINVDSYDWFLEPSTVD